MSADRVDQRRGSSESVADFEKSLTNMNIRIQIRHDSANDRIKNFITSEFERLQEKFEQMITSAEFIVDQQGPTGHIKTFECILHVPGDTITVHEQSDEIHKSIDAAMRVAEKLLKRHKETFARPGTMIRHNIEREQFPEGNIS